MLYQAAVAEAPYYAEERQRLVSEAQTLLAEHGWFSERCESELPAEHVTVPMLLAGRAALVINELGDTPTMTRGKSLDIKVSSGGPVERINLYVAWKNPRLPYYSVFDTLLRKLREDFTLNGAIRSIDFSIARAIPVESPQAIRRDGVTAMNIRLAVTHNFIPTND